MAEAGKDESSNDGTTLELPSDRELLITRSFRAPAARVLEALTRPEYVKRWWAPASRGSMVQCDIDFRVGGAWRFVMRTNSGDEVGFSGKYLEIDSPHRVVQTEIFDPFPDSAATVTLTLTEANGRTTMASRSLYPSREVRDMVIASGMEDGMRESMLQLDSVVLSLV
jgi:uncharacterized protein YndB with AHSA1/START domain